MYFKYINGIGLETAKIVLQVIQCLLNPLLTYKVKLNENTLLTGCEDGYVRIVSTYPNKCVVFERHAED